MRRALVSMSEAAAALVLASGITACHRAPPPAAAIARPAAVTRDVVTTGTVEALSSVQVGAQISGTIDRLLVDYNSLVRKGQVMAHIESSVYQANLKLAQGALGDARGQLEYAVASANDAHLKLQQAQALRASETITAQDLEDAQVAADQGDAQVRSAKALAIVSQAQVDQATIDLEHTTITSPIDGVVVARDVDKGQTVSASVATPVLFVVAPDLRQMQVEATVDESDVGRVQNGEVAHFTVGAYPSQQFEGRVATVRLVPPAPPTTAASPSTPAPPTTAASPSTPAVAVGTATSAASTSTVSTGTVVTYDAIVLVPNPDERLRPGMTAIVTFPTPIALTR